MKTRWTALPPQLQNWRVVEVEGQALPVIETPVSETTATDGEASTQAEHELTDRLDELIVLTVPNRRISIPSGASDAISTSILNNGSLPLDLEITVQGDVEMAWFPGLPLRVHLQPGERQNLKLPISILADHRVDAGTYNFAVIVSSVDQPDRFSRAICSVTIEPTTDFRLGYLQPERVISSWWSPSVQTVLPITNLSNRRLDFRVVGADAERACVFEFQTPGSIYPQAGSATFTLAPGERNSVAITLLPRRQSAISLASQERSFRVAVEIVDDDSVLELHEHVGPVGRDRLPKRRQVVEGQLVSSALIGPWQLATTAVFVAFTLLAVVLAVAAILLALLPSENQVDVVPTAEPAPAPAFALILSMDEPVPTRVPSAVNSVVGAATPAVDPATSPATALAAVPEANGLPVVQADQVSAPGEATVAPPQAQSRPTPVAVAPANSDNMTYAQMFQQVAARYDLNWRMLAALGYVESGFDSNAVGTQGSLGLMQVHPDTWAEWAPRVDVVDPFETYGNVLVAAIYLDYLRATLGKQGYPQVEWMLAAYNWGPDKVLNLVAGGGGWTDLPADVQQYAADVLRIAQSIPEN